VKRKFRFLPPFFTSVYFVKAHYLQKFVSIMTLNTFADKERYCAATFDNGGPYWHVCTPGHFTEILFETDDDYRFIMNTVAIAVALSQVKIITFEIMSNHVHFILEGAKEDCLDFFDKVKRRLKRYLQDSGRYVNLDGFKTDPIPIETLESLRIEVVYVNRNGYLVHPEHTPFSYPWGSSSLFFNNIQPLAGLTPYSNLTVLEKRAVCKGRAADLPGNYIVANGLILPQCYCNLKKGMALFRDAHHYFSMLSKKYEAYSEVAGRLHDQIFLTDEEMLATMKMAGRKRFGESRISMLPVKDKMDLAKDMRLQYNATEGQIQRLLRLDRKIVAELFGK